MGIRGWAAATAVAACAWAGSAGAAVYSVKLTPSVDPTIEYIPAQSMAFDPITIHVGDRLWIGIEPSPMPAWSRIDTFKATLHGTMPDGSPLLVSFTNYFGIDYRRAVFGFNPYMGVPQTYLYAGFYTSNAGASGAFILDYIFRPFEADGIVLTSVDFSATGFFATPAPEPSTWAMMMIGFGGLVFAATRRRHAVVMV